MSRFYTLLRQKVPL